MIALLRKLLLQDFWLKLFSLALAILIWLTVWFAIRKDVSPITGLSGPTAEQTYYNVPVQVVFLAANVRNVQINPTVVEVRVRADSKLLKRLKPDDIQAVVNLTKIEAGGLRQRIDISTPPGVTFVQVVPDEVEVLVPSRN